MKKSSLCFIGLAALLLSKADVFAASPVQAPPLPRGSDKVLMQPGQDPGESARNIHAHQKPKKDKQRDDTLPSTVKDSAPASDKPAAGNGK